MSDDATLLRQYVEEGTETAFRELVERHIPLVNATARRMTGGDTHLADDVTQLVFTDLARKTAKLPGDVLLGGWLHRHTCYTAMKAVRGESRRRARERTAMETNLLNENSACDEQWAKLAPMLDEALNQLGEEDRNAIVLRYLQQQDVRSIGLALGTSENAAQKRLGRALDKLRKGLTRRGITVSAGLLSIAMDAGAATAPMSTGLAASVSASALSSAAAGSATTSFLTITSIKAMSSTKTKLAIGAVVAVAIIGTTTVVLKLSNAPNMSASAPTLQAQVATAPTTGSKLPVVSANPAKIEMPKMAPAPAGDSPYVNNPPGSAAGAGNPVADPSAQPTITTSNGQPIPDGQVFMGTVNVNGRAVTGPMIVSGRGGSGSVPPIDLSALGTPASTKVNPDGSTTNTFVKPNGQKIAVTQDANGNIKSMSSMMQGANANIATMPGTGTASSVNDPSAAGGTDNGQASLGQVTSASGPVSLLGQNSLGTPTSSVMNPDGTTTNTYSGPNGQTISVTQDANGKTVRMSSSAPGGNPNPASGDDSQ